MTDRNSPSDHNETLPPESSSDLETLPPRPIPVDSSIPGLSGDFGRYKIQALLGQGGMGAVYLALDTQLDRLVALKTPRFENDKDGELLQRFYCEAKTAGTVRHPNICPVYAVEELNGRPFMAMAYIEGRPLSDYINPEKPRTERQALVVIRKLALAIQDAHDHGIIHRDLKPANVMIDKRGEPIVMDFGLARPIEIEQDSRITSTGVVMGSPAYMAPEQIDGEFGTVGPATDQYALGVILYEMLTGNVPFRGSVAAIYGKIVTRAPIPPRRLRPRLDPRVDALALRMMSKRPSERLPTMKAVAEAAQEILLNPPEKVSGKTTATSLKRRTPAEVAAMVVAANKLMRQHQYEKAVELLEQVAPDDRTAELNGVLEQALELNDEVTFLTARLLNAWTKETYKEEIASVRRLLELVPGHSLGEKILEKIEEDAESWWAGISFSTPLGLSGLSSIAQWSLFVTVVFIATFGTMVYYYDLANSSLKSLPLISRDEHATKPDQVPDGPAAEPSESPPEKVAVIPPLLAAPEKFIAPVVKPPEELKAPFNLATAQAAQRDWGEYLKQPVEYTNSLGMKIRLIPPGRFRMGSLESMEEVLKFDKENGVAQPKVAMFEDEFPAHEVHITPFALGSTEVTLGQFRAFTDATKYVTQAEKNQNGQGYIAGKLAPERGPQFSFRNIGVPQGDNEPVVNVSRVDALAFCDWLSKKEKRKYRLPYEAEWEYACRAGTTTRFSCGDDPQQLIRFGNVADASGRSRFTNWVEVIRGKDGFALTSPVGTFLPNSFGLYDMHGNVWELCHDFHSNNYHKVSPGEQTPQGPDSGTDRVIRGGSYNSFPHSDRSSTRQNTGSNNADCNMGFRVALEIPTPGP